MKTCTDHRLIACAIALALPAFSRAQSEEARGHEMQAPVDAAPRHARGAKDRPATDHAKMYHAGMSNAVMDHAHMRHDGAEPAAGAEADALPPSDHVPPPAPTHEMARCRTRR